MFGQATANAGAARDSSRSTIALASETNLPLARFFLSRSDDRGSQPPRRSHFEEEER
jgi:hypothetical protein